jgi:hypothetical protein
MSIPKDILKHFHIDKYNFNEFYIKNFKINKAK